MFFNYIRICQKKWNDKISIYLEEENTDKFKIPEKWDGMAGESITDILIKISKDIRI